MCASVGSDNKTKKLQIETEGFIINYLKNSVRRFLQKNENRPKKPGEPVFKKNRFENRNYGKKDTTRYSVFTQDVKRKVF